MLLVTGKLAKPRLEAVVERLRRAGIDAELLVLNYDVASLIPFSEIKRVARNVGKRYDVIVIPPGIRGDFEQVHRETGTLIVRGPNVPEALIDILPTLDVRRLKPGEQLTWQPRLDSIKPVCAGVLRCGLCVPLRPPPFLLFAEVFVAKKLDKSRVAYASRYSHCVILGFTKDTPRSKIYDVVDEVKDMGLNCVGVDYPDLDTLLDLVDHVDVLLSVRACEARKIADALAAINKDAALILIPCSNSPRDVLMEFREALEALKDSKIIPILDPVLKPACQGLLASLELYHMLSDNLRAPLMAGLGNVYELMDVDPHGVIALLIALLGEAGVSALLISGESWKARRAFEDAAKASLLVSIAMSLSTYPKDLGIELLEAREKRPSNFYSGHIDEVIEAGKAPAVPFERDPAGDNIVEALPDGNLRVVHVWRDGRVTVVKGKDPERIYRVALKLGFATRLDHAAWLGKELGVAATLAKFGRTYSSLHYVEERRLEEFIEKYLGILWGSVNPATPHRPKPQTP